MFRDYVVECVRKDQYVELLRDAEKEWLFTKVTASRPAFRERLLPRITHLFVTAKLWLAARYYPWQKPTWSRH